PALAKQLMETIKCLRSHVRRETQERMRSPNHDEIHHTIA
ncbi:unnamed protein product, partial [marine sediment metagenome]